MPVFYCSAAFLCLCVLGLEPDCGLWLCVWSGVYQIEKRGQYELLFGKSRYNAGAPVVEERFMGTNPARAGEGLDFKAPFSVVERAPKELPATSYTNPDDGLGQLPEYMPSVTAMLLFNSTENPYRGYVPTELLLGNAGEEEARRQAAVQKPTPKSGKKLAKAPHSVQHGHQLPSFGVLDFGYNPELGTVPTLNLP